MENWRNDPVTEGQHGKIRFINAMLGLNFRPQNKGDAAEFINANAEAADRKKAEQQREKDEAARREQEATDFFEKKTKRPPNTTKNTPQVWMDYDIVKEIAGKNGVIMEDIDRKLGHSGGYLAGRARRNGGMISFGDALKIANMLYVGVPTICPGFGETKSEPEQEENEAPENCVQFNALGVQLKDRNELAEFEAIMQIIGMTERDFTTMAFFAMFDRLKSMTVPALLQFRERRINRIAQRETSGKLKGTETSVTILDEMAAEDADNAD